MSSAIDAELPAQVGLLTQMLLEEIYPVAAYYQDTGKRHSICPRCRPWHPLPEFVAPLSEFHCEVHSLLHTAISEGRVSADARPLAEREIEGLVGWMMQKN